MLSRHAVGIPSTPATFLHLLRLHCEVSLRWTRRLLPHCSLGLRRDLQIALVRSRWGVFALRVLRGERREEEKDCKPVLLVPLSSESVLEEEQG